MCNMINKNLHSKGRTLQSSRLATMTSSFIENQNQTTQAINFKILTFPIPQFSQQQTKATPIHNVKLWLKTPRPQIVVKKKYY